ncbi:ribosome-associated translation inhibitor RaiA [candidate division TA06 bacterium]|uniref:Ribosome-associated translation inhibitor RaiA n=1 Tax=candidate division TA06 bacterium TaxID=2250710 RepID=A0A933IAS8_UNCT6|nr:ribosome-associated translation inhibitor RaiA [candidate division TA06 bacterium]
MRINITARHFEGLTEGLKKDVQSRLEHLEHFFPRILEARAILTEEKKRMTAEVTIHLPAGKRLAAKEQGMDMRQALDLAVKKIETQVKKVKERKEHKGRGLKGQ